MARARLTKMVFSDVLETASIVIRILDALLKINVLNESYPGVHTSFPKFVLVIFRSSFLTNKLTVHTCFQSMEYLLDIMYTDYKNSGQCRLQLAKEGFMNFILSFGLQKGSAYTTSITEG